MHIVVDLNRCQSYGQCVFAAPTVFRMHGEEALEYDYEPDEALRLQVERAAAACPVRAISIERADEPFVGNSRPGAKEERAS
ncbi:MAG TPA: ferredoxin [Gemmataceae bacterium]|nr:ferredoxin [Gemmataceae bacterium]